MELIDQSQSTFGDMVSELGLAAAMRPQAEYTLLAPLNAAFSGTLLKTNSWHHSDFWQNLNMYSTLSFLTELLL